MKQKIVQTENIMRLHEASTSLMERPPGMPGMALVHAPTGFGKSLACAWLNARVHGVYVRARALSTPGSFLGSILRELDVAPEHSCARMVDQIVDRLAMSGRPLMVDEADYIVDQSNLVDTLRDVHDLSTVPVILIGEDKIKRNIAKRHRLAGRMAQDVQFTGMDDEDARLVADELCEVGVANDLLEDLNRKAGGEIRRVVIGLSRIEQRAKQLNTETLDLRAWGKADYFVGRIAPAPEKAGRVARVK